MIHTTTAPVIDGKIRIEIDQECEKSLAGETCPYSIGDRIGVREAWHDERDEDGDRILVVRYSQVAEKRKHLPNAYDWQPADSMPDEAIRKWYRITSIDTDSDVSSVDTPARQWYWILSVKERIK